jgi:hypothetical protein
MCQGLARGARPTVHQSHRNDRLFPPNDPHESWLAYFSWDTEPDPQCCLAPPLVRPALNS